MVGQRALIAAALVAAAISTASCSADGPATDFCNSYGNAMHEVVAAARSYATSPGAFSKVYKSTMDGIDAVRAKAPDDHLRSAFDRSMFTFSVFDVEQDLADFLARADFSGNAVVIACAEYGVNLSI